MEFKAYLPDRSEGVLYTTKITNMLPIAATRNITTQRQSRTTLAPKGSATNWPRVTLMAGDISTLSVGVL